MLGSVKTLHELGFKLYASLGTADFYTEHGIKVRIAIPQDNPGCRIVFFFFWYRKNLFLSMMSTIQRR